MASREKRLDFDYDIDLSSEEIGGERPFPEPVRAVGSVETKSGITRLTARIGAHVVTACARCLTPVEYDKDVDVSLILTRSVDNDEIDDIIYVESDEVDLDDLLVPERIPSCCARRTARVFVRNAERTSTKATADATEGSLIPDWPSSRSF